MKDSNTSRSGCETSRRDFLKIISLLSAGTVLPSRAANLIFSDGISVTRVKDHFSLNKFYPSVESLIVQDMNYQKGDPFYARYSLFSLGYDHFRKEGNVTYKWEKQSDNNFCNCIIERDSKTAGLKNIYTLDSRHANDLHHSPVDWRWDAKFAESPDAPAFALTALSGQAFIEEGQVHILRNGNKFTRSLRGSPMLKWGHLCMLPMLDDDANMTFSWIDEMEQVFEGHRLQFREYARISVNHGQLNLYAFQQTGTGIIPTVYWLNENHILFFIVSGTEIYMLDEFNSHTVRYNVPIGRLNRNRE